MTSSRITTQVLEAATGVPAVGMHVELSGRDGAAWRVLAEATTDVDGRVLRLGGDDLPAGEYRIRFDTGAWYRARNVATTYPEAVVTFLVTDDGRHVHVPLLLSPLSYSTP
ncbi:hydroxyisourate hydrolase [Agromyces bauzanensis]|uniref:hydroxyisourate hydrolase n=1 Tax=Agromyces bauzanensis TaxID=1308924 RepID=UPI00166507B9|nr:hydroxyisourate hydrolase [Agromyces bauzanensis]